MVEAVGDRVERDEPLFESLPTRWCGTPSPPPYAYGESSKKAKPSSEHVVAVLDGANGATAAPSAPTRPRPYNYFPHPRETTPPEPKLLKQTAADATSRKTMRADGTAPQPQPAAIA